MQNMSQARRNWIDIKEWTNVNDNSELMRTVENSNMTRRTETATIN